MSAAVSERQLDGVIAASAALRRLQVPSRWLLVRLTVLVDGRLVAVREEAARRAAAALLAEVAALTSGVSVATQGHEGAAVTLRQMRQWREQGLNGGLLLALPDEDAIDRAAELLAAGRHSVLVVATAPVDGLAVAPRWS